MSLQNLDKAKLKQILQTSEGFTAQFQYAKMVENTKREAGPNNKPTKIVPSYSGHPLQNHLRGAPLNQGQKTVRKTKFCSLDDMAEALDLALKTPDGTAALAQLQPGVRKVVNAQLNQTFDVEGEFDMHPPQKVKFTRADLARAGFSSMRCCAVLDARARGPELYLHVQTFYPEFTALELTRLLDAKTGP